MPILANQEKCTACMACLNACAKGAISFVQDGESFLQPQVDAKRCVECHLCEKVCPEIQQEYHQYDTSGDVYAGWNITDRQVSSSGGAFSTIAKYVLAKSLTASASVKPMNSVSIFSLIAPCWRSFAKISASSLESSSQETIIVDGERLSYSAFDSRRNSGLKMIFFVLYFSLTDAV